MSSGDVVKALGPGTKLQSLSSFAPEYKSVSAAFNELLVFPHLETISISDDPTDTQNLRSVVVDGQAKLVGLTDIDVKLARNVVAYSSTLEALLPALQIALLVATMQPIAQGYADEARTQMNANLKFFGELSDYITELDRRIGDMSTKLTQLDKAIKDQSEALAKLNIGKALYDIFKEIFKLSSNLDESNIQISQLLNLDVSTLQGSFSTLFADRIKLQQVLDSLTYMRNQISSLQKKFTVLSNSLTSVTVSSASLLDVWDDVADRMSAVSDDQSTATPAQIQTLTNQWSAVSNDANAYIKALTDTTFLVKDFAALRSQFGTFKKVPVTKHELAVYKLAVAAGIIGDVGVEKAISQYVAANDQISAAANVSDEDAKIVKGVLGPPTDAKEQLDELADRTGKIVDQFNTLLQQPYLEQLACTNPLDGSETNIFVMVTGFKQEYVALQQKTLPVARDLQAYAELQIALLPIVVAKDPKPGNLTLEDFIATNKPLVADYLVKATELSAESTAIQKKWDNAIAVVQKAINECTSNIEKWQASVDQLSEELKKVKLYAALAAAGAFIAFTAAVFLPGIGMLAALGVGGVLGALSIKEAIDASKLIQAINELKSAIKNEEATRAKLESLLPYMTNIAKSLSQVSQIWSDIATALTTLNNFYAVLGGPTGSIILDRLRPTIIESWKTVSASVKAYIDAVAK